MSEENKNNQYLIGLRSYLSSQHLFSAYYLSQKAKNIESNFNGTDIKTIYIEHRSSVVGSILFTICFLESYINEMCADISDNMLFGYSGINKNRAKILSSLWGKGIPRTARYSILEKYEIVFDVLSSSKIDKGKPPYQDVQLLIQLRNSLTHYESEWVFHNPSKFNRNDLTHKFEKSLKGKFSLNPITGEGNSFFPDKCLGYGCTKWGLINSINYIIQYFDNSNIKPSNIDSILKVRDLII